jgi:putative transposase
MPRTARIAPAECVYHVLTRGNNREAVFRDERDFKKYLDLLSRYKEKFQFKLYHYVLMKNHVHLVLETVTGKGNLSEIMKGINVSYAQYYKGRYKHIGHFWQDRYKSIIISKDDYPWSSYGVYAYGNKDGLVDEHPIYLNLTEGEGERRKRYKEFVRGMIKERSMMRGEMDRRRIYGSEGLTKKITTKYKVEAVIMPKGRPRKDGREDK